MVEENRKFLFKCPDSSVDILKDKSKEVAYGIRKDRRDKIVSTKRFRNDSYITDVKDENQYNVNKVQNVSKSIQKKSHQTQEQLKFLRNAFSYTSDFVDAFLEVDNSLYALVGYLTGTDSVLQLEAAWCITNISANDHKRMMTVVKATAPYLITYLQSGSILLQDQSAWALGNMAADSDDVRRILKMQGAVLPLISLVQHETLGVVQAALFALCNMARSLDLVVTDFIETNLVDSLVRKLSNKELDINILCEVAWLLTYFTSNKTFYEFFTTASRVLEYLSHWLCKVRPHQQEYFFAVTPLLRCLGNLIGSEAKLQTDTILRHENGLILSSLNSFLVSNKHYLIKECLWVMANLFASEIDMEQSSKDLELVLPNVIRHLNSAYEIKKEAVLCIYNLACRDSFLDTIINKHVFETLITFFKIPDVELVSLTLKTFELILRRPNARQLFYDLEGPSYLEPLEYNDCEELRTRSSYIQKTFYENDDDADTIS